MEFTRTVKLEELLSPQEFTALTEIIPDIAVGPKVTWMLFVELVPVAPGGKVQI